MAKPDATRNRVSLKEFAESHNDALYDVVALLDAAAARIEEATPNYTEEPDAAEAMHNTLRLVQIAFAKVQTVADCMLHQR